MAGRSFSFLRCFDLGVPVFQGFPSFSSPLCDHNCACNSLPVKPRGRKELQKKRTWLPSCYCELVVSQTSWVSPGSTQLMALSCEDQLSLAEQLEQVFFIPCSENQPAETVQKKVPFTWKPAEPRSRQPCWATRTGFPIHCPLQFFIVHWQGTQRNQNNCALVNVTRPSILCLTQ